MVYAFNRMKEIGGGIVLAENGKSFERFRLTLRGLMSDQPIEELIDRGKDFVAICEKAAMLLRSIHSLLFFSSTHLPYIRITNRDV